MEEKKIIEEATEAVKNNQNAGCYVEELLSIIRHLQDENERLSIIASVFDKGRLTKSARKSRKAKTALKRTKTQKPKKNPPKTATAQIRAMRGLEMVMHSEYEAETTKIMLKKPITKLLRLIGRKWFLPLEKLSAQSGVPLQTTVRAANGEKILERYERRLTAFLEDYKGDGAK